ncbi:MAG: hypothetical protein FWG68_04630, partial [Defluviitaleaceae bacterium]|nr:hypothetical protein [Defluviitaleaceae bacterium]
PACRTGRGRSPLPDRRQAGGDAYCRGDRPRSPVRLIPNASIKVYAGGADNIPYETAIARY